MDENNYTTQSGFFYNIEGLRKLSSLLIFISFIITISAGFIYLCNLPYFTISKFKIHPQNLEINLNIIQKQLSQQRYHFFTPSLDEVRKIFEAIPSVKTARVLREYPDSLEIILQKHQPFAKWGLQDDMYINTQGEIYQGSSYDEARVSINLDGDNENSKYILNQYNVLQTMFKEKITSFKQTNEKNFVIKLANNQTLTLGKEDNYILTKKINFWKKSWDTLKNNSLYKNVNTFDLRYNGFTMEIPSQELHDENISTSSNKPLIIDNED